MISEELLLSWGANYRTIKKNEILFTEGSECSFYFQVSQGKFKWVNNSEDGKEYLQQIVDEGGCIGILPLFDDDNYAATAIALVDSTIIRLPKTSFLELLAKYPDVHIAFSKYLAVQLRFKIFLLKEMTSHEPQNLIVALLKYLKDNHQYVSGEDELVELTRQQIADLTGLRVETVIRVIRNLYQEGTLIIDNRKVYLK